jgi:hypothetical protein
MIFGRKRRPSQRDEGQMSTDLAELGAVAEDEDIIELLDVVEIPEDRRAGAALHDQSDDDFDEEFAEEASAFDMTPHEVADLLEDDSAEILEDEEMLAAERLFSEPGREASGLVREGAWTKGVTDAFEDEEAALSKDFDMDKILREDDSDKLIADFMASHRPGDVDEVDEGGVLVEEYAVEDQDLPLFRRDEESFQGSDREGLTDFGVLESEPSGLGADDDMARMFEAALAEEMAAESEAENASDELRDLALEKMIAAELAAEGEAETVDDHLSDLDLGKMIAAELAVEVDAETTPAVLADEPPVAERDAGAASDHLMEEQVPVATQAEETELASVVEQAQVPLELRVEPGEAVTAEPAAEIVASFVDETPFTLVEEVEPPMDQVPASGTIDVLAPGSEPLFSISAISTMARDAMAVEEEILFAYRPAEEAPEVGGRPDFAGAVAEKLQVQAVERESDEKIEAEPPFTLDTFYAVGEGEPSSCTRGMDLLELVAHMETRLMGNLQNVAEPPFSELIRGAVKDELEGLRRLIDHIEEAEDLRL